MKKKFSSRRLLNDFPIWKKLDEKRALCSFEFDLTSRCNLNCRHCYINLPAGDKQAMVSELSVEEIKKIAGESVALGAFWCLVTGGEPLLRNDFFDVFLSLKRAGLLVSLFTNATLVTEEHARFLKKYPPRDVEITVYGATPETYERVTRVPGSFKAFRRGLELLARTGIPVTLKAMAMRSNLHEMPEIIRFCLENGDRHFRFDPFLHLRYDRDPARNEEIRSERLSPGEIVALEKSYLPRFEALKANCESCIDPGFAKVTSHDIFSCGIGKNAYFLSSDGIFRFCPSLSHPDLTLNLRKGGLVEAWRGLIGRIRAMRSDRKEFLENCRVCPIVNLCMWCPANAYLETGHLDQPVDYFCRLAHAREKILSE